MVRGKKLIKDLLFVIYPLDLFKDYYMFFSGSPSGGKSAEWHFVCEFSDRPGGAVRTERGVQHPPGGDRGPAAAGVPCGGGGEGH